MGTITIKVPKDICVEYIVDSIEIAEKLIKQLELDTGSVESGTLLGLFADEPGLIDQITESAMKARENDLLRVA